MAIKKVKKMINKKVVKKSSTKQNSNNPKVNKAKKKVAHKKGSTKAKKTKTTTSQPVVKNDEKKELVNKPSPSVVEKSSSAASSPQDRPVEQVPSTQINLKESGKFWMVFIAVGIGALIIVQSYGYITGWGDSNKVIERHFNQAQRLTLAKRYQAAIKQYQKVIKMKQSKEESKRQAMVGIADLYREKKEWKQAIQMYEELQKLEDHTVMSAWSGLKIAESQIAAGEPENALDTYKQIRERFPNSDWDAEARLGQGQANEALKAYKQAIAIYQALEKDYQGGFLAADALIQIGRCYEQLGNKQEARKTYQYVINVYPETMADEAKRRLKRLSQGKHPLGIRNWDN